MLRYFTEFAKRVVTETEKSDLPDKQQRDGIGEEASVDVAIGGETSVNIAAVDNKPLSAPRVAVSAPCNQAAVLSENIM